MTTTVNDTHRYHVEVDTSDTSPFKFQAICRCGYRSPCRPDRVDAASYGTEHCLQAEKLS